MLKKIKLVFIFTIITFNLLAQATWVRKNEISSRVYPVSFTMGGHGFVGSGTGSNSQSDFWEYDPISNFWKQLDFIPGVRQGAVAFVIDSFAYVGTGLDLNVPAKPKSDFYRYDVKSNTWTAIKSLTNGVYGAVGFSSGGKGYVCGGYNGTKAVNELWEYNVSNDSWTKKTNFPGSARNYAVAFNIVKNTFIGSGIGGSNKYSDFYCYNSDSDKWHQIKSIPISSGFHSGSAFGVYNVGYVCGGFDGTNNLKYLYQYDPKANSWTKLSDFVGTAFRGGVGFCIGSRGYVGLGTTQYSSFNTEFYVYESLGTSMSADSIGRKIHLKGSTDSAYITSTNIFDQYNEFVVQISSDGFKRTIYDVGKLRTYEEGKHAISIKIPIFIETSDSFRFRVTGTYKGSGKMSVNSVGTFSIIDTLSTKNDWVQKQSFPLAGRLYPFSFSVFGHGFVGGGFDSIYVCSDFWDYDPVNDTWTQAASYPKAIYEGVSFVIDFYAYVGSGAYSNSPNSYNSEFYRFDYSKNIWTSIKSLDRGGVGFSSGGKGYVCGEELWEYDPQNDSWSQKKKYPLNNRSYKVAFTIGNNTYVGSGYDGFGGEERFFCYNSDSDKWNNIKSFPLVGGFFSAVGFSVGGHGYIVGGRRGNGHTDLKFFSQYDPITDTWTPMKEYAGDGFMGGAGFSIGGSCYAGMGMQGSSMYDGWYRYQIPLASSILEVSKSVGISVYPNPSNGIYNIVLSSTSSQNHQINIINALGQIVYTKSISENTMQLDLADYNSGIYIIQVRDKNNLVGEVKIIKQ